MTLLLLSLCGMGQTVLDAEIFKNKLSSTPNGQLLDVRTFEEYAQGHLKNSLNIDVTGSSFEQKTLALDKSQPVFVYCLSGARSAKAAKQLVDNGFKEVYDMKGGYLKWSSAQLPIDKNEHLAKGVEEISQDDFEKLIASDKPVLLDFFATWCAPCKQMMPTMQKLTKDYEGKAVIKTINYDKNKALTQRLQIDEIPIFLLYKNGKLLWRGMGLMPEKEFKEIIEANL
ncbi:thioredoxin domain-containing protein [Arundinibacter roseus]|nr:thioredoxin domain-containing protein [Arundinibacter roseus]